MSSNTIRNVDRVEAFSAAIDIYEPSRLQDHEDAFRVFARFISQSIDGRYLERHPSEELLPDLEDLMTAGLVRQADEIKICVHPPSEERQRACLTLCLPEHLFVYSTVMLALNNLGVRHYRVLNNIVPIIRSVSGDISSIGQAGASLESFLWLDVEFRNIEGREKEVVARLDRELRSAQIVVRDFPAICAMVEEVATRSEHLARTRPDQRVAHENNARFLRWLVNENFVFLGTKFLEREGTTPCHLTGNYGLGSVEDEHGQQIEDAERAVAEFGGIPPYLWIRKSKRESTIYRAGHMDHVMVQCWDAEGKPAGLVVLEGTFSYQALAKPRTEVPLLDRTIDQLFSEMQAAKGTHRYRTIRNAFNSLPMEYLFMLQVDDIRQLIEQFLEIDADQRVQIHITTDEMQSFAFVFVGIPRSHYSEELRVDVRKLLKEKLQANSVSDGVYAGNERSVTFHYFLTGAHLDPQAEQALRAEVEDLASPWSDRLLGELMRRHDVKKSRPLHHLYADAFPTRYREETSIGRAVTDIELLEELDEAFTFDCDIYRERADRRLGITRLRLLQSGDMLLLSDILPALDNLGLTILDEFPTTVQVPGRSERIVSTFRIRPSGMKIDLLTRRNRLRSAIRAIVAQAIDNDPLNRLLLRADIPWTYVALLRAYQHYARQIGSPYTMGLVQETLEQHPNVVRALTELFRAKFDPSIEGVSAYEVDDRRRELVDRTRRALTTLLAGVNDLTSDQLLRSLCNLVEATVRTNFFARDPIATPQIVIKLDPSQITRMPEPVPYREIYVHHPRVAGLHLRGGPVARGGIRWSDRRLDFRTEVLDLMATQNLKNVVIIPRGAKGSFVLRNPPAEPMEKRREADAMYRIFIDGLLSVTDTLTDEGKVKHQAGIIHWDAPDHYLVVAADKGTAHLSDTANAVAAEHSFWLDDAFASGGSKGYDHKVEGITAKGAWECVKRHFHEVNMDPERDAITVAGIGDMSGDVFGNGMLLSHSMKLIGAFDHRDIFIDPDPKPEASWKARKVLFDTPRSSWADYPKELISTGGGVYPRDAKSITLSEEAKTALGIKSETISGPELVQAVLKAPVDLLWNGGIGTYIKATEESNLDLGDPSNDAVRVDATDVRTRVLGEGGNLGVTSLGRVELAAHGVRLNSDAVDNSAGVDLSDHEVNLKILFAGMVRRKELTMAERDVHMRELGPACNEMVLANNWVQSRMISLDEGRSKRDLARFQRAITFLGNRVPFKRRSMHLPGERILGERAAKGLGLFRPELAILAANAKLDLRQELVDSKRFGPDELREYLLEYFPPSMLERFEKPVKNHPLGIHIARAVLVNNVIGDAGASWLSEMTIRTGRNTEDILDAHIRAARLLDAGTLKQSIGQQESRLSTTTEYELRLTLANAVEETSTWLLRYGGLGKGFADALARTMQILPDGVPRETSEELSSQVVSLRMANVPEALAEQLVMLTQVVGALEIAQLALDETREPHAAAVALRIAGAKSGLSEILAGAANHDDDMDLDRPARIAVRAQLRQVVRKVAQRLLRTEKNIRRPRAPTKRWLQALSADLEPLQGSGSVASLVLAVDRAQGRINATPE